MIDWSHVKRIHLIGVAGTGMGAFAGMLKAAGYEVTGSDENVYPPMSTQLERWGIEVMTPYSPENLDRARPDLVVVGNVVRAVNPEAAAMRDRGLPHVSFPQALGEAFIGPRHGVVVVGTHGKTTTSAMMGVLLHHAGRDPSFLVGGVTRDFGSNYRLGGGPHFVVEGDEYDTAYFDKGPKFLHYRPRTAIFTSCELDHADIYRDEAHYESAFERFVTLVPEDGFLAACASYDSVLRIARGRSLPRGDLLGRSARRGLGGAKTRALARGRALHARAQGRGARGGPPPRGRRPQRRERARRRRRGHRARALARRDRRWPRRVPRGEASPGGAREGGGVTVIDDFAHHPRAVQKTLAAIRGAYPGARLLAAFEPRSNTSRRNLHQRDYAAPATWGDAAEVFLLRPAPTDRVPESERLDVDAVVREVSAAGTPARAFTAVDELVPAIAAARARATSWSSCRTARSAGIKGSCSRRWGADLGERSRGACSSRRRLHEGALRSG